MRRDQIVELEQLLKKLIVSPDPVHNINKAIDIIASCPSFSHNDVGQTILRDLRTRYRRWMRALELNAPAFIVENEYHWVCRLVEAAICASKGLPFELTAEEIEDLKQQAAINNDQ